MEDGPQRASRSLVKLVTARSGAEQCLGPGHEGATRIVDVQPAGEWEEVPVVSARRCEGSARSAARMQGSIRVGQGSAAGRGPGAMARLGGPGAEHRRNVGPRRSRARILGNMPPSVKGPIRRPRTTHAGPKPQSQKSPAGEPARLDGGANGTRTHDFYDANVALSQLSYCPKQASVNRSPPRRQPPKRPGDPLWIPCGQLQEPLTR